VSIGLVVVGCGGFGREVFSLVEAVNAAHGPQWTVTGFVDDAPSDEDRARVEALGSRILGPVASLVQDRHAPAAVVAIGSPAARAAVSSSLDGRGLRFPALIHPAASVGRAVTLGEGVVIGAGARLSTNITLGAHVQVDQNATIGHDTCVGDYSRLNPQACVSGSVLIATHVLIGANATVLPSLRVGSGATVGAQACVVRDVEAGTVVKGVPAR
jgi:sugar O-acyltransferase (sialic acid O-acetyltransferase NeuD family)